MDLNKETIKKIIFILFSAIAFYCALQNASVVIAVFFHILGLFMPFLLGGAIAFILNIPMSRIEGLLFKKDERFRSLHRPLAYLITLLLTIGVLTLVIFVVAPELGRTLRMLTDQIPDFIGSLQAQLQSLSSSLPEIQFWLTQIDIDWAALTQKAISLLQNSTTALLGSGFGFAGRMINGVVTFFVSFIFSIYLLLQKERLACQGKQVLYALLPIAIADRALEVLALANTTFSRFFSGQCIESVILGSMFFLSMTLFQMPYALLTGVLVAVTALIPVVGAFIGCGVGAFLIVIVSPWKALQFIILFLVLQQVEGNLIYPHVVGNSVGLPSIWVLAAVTVGGKLLGIAGMLLFIPLCSVCYALLRSYLKDRLKRRKIPPKKWSTQTKK